MKKRIAKKVYLSMSYGTERRRIARNSYYFRQPYTINQQLKAMKALGLTNYTHYIAGMSLKR